MEQEVNATAVGQAGGSKQFKTAEAIRFTLIGPGVATITQGITGSITVTAPAGDLEHIEVEQGGESLTVTFHGGLVRHRGPQGPIRYTLSVPVLEELTLSGGLAAEATNFEERDLKVELKDASSLALEQFRAVQLEARVDGGSRLTATGTVSHLKLKLGAKSNYQGGGLEAEEADIEAGGGSEATVRVTKKLKAKADGGSIVSYSGPKVDLNVTTSAGSELRQAHS